MRTASAPRLNKSTHITVEELNRGGGSSHFGCTAGQPIEVALTEVTYLGYDGNYQVKDLYCRSWLSIVHIQVRITMLGFGPFHYKRIYIGVGRKIRQYVQ